MKLAFDLISDLHVETWPEPFDWTGMATSMICVVAGDISRDRQVVIDTLRHLGNCYRAVFYVDGNDEHRYSLHDLGDSYKTLAEELADIPNVVFLQDNVVIVDGVAFLGTNGWWTYDLDDNVDYDQTKLWFQDRYQIPRTVADGVEAMALQDYAYLSRSVERLQTHQDVERIVLITHTVPMLQLVDHDPEVADTYRINCVGNSHILRTLAKDTERKVSNWVFGHYHNDIDRTFEDVRFSNNCRGRGNTPWSKSVYNPKRIEIDY
jgi:Icc-related predicted phosphoesterase